MNRTPAYCPGFDAINQHQETDMITPATVAYQVTFFASSAVLLAGDKLGISQPAQWAAAAIVVLCVAFAMLTDRGRARFGNGPRRDSQSALDAATRIDAPSDRGRPQSESGNQIDTVAERTAAVERAALDAVRHAQRVVPAA